jgi:hypothetical protein
MCALLCVALGVAFAPADAAAQPHGPDGYIPIPPAEIEARLKAGGFRAVKAKHAGGGVTGAQKVDLKHPEDGFELTIKWKPVPNQGDGWNNSPRRELAAYEVQKWFLDPVDYVVPTTVAFCPPFEFFEPIGAEPKANIGSFECVLGVASVWLDNVTVPTTLYERERFDGDSEYARHMANMNLLAYLIEHKDGRGGNFLTSKDEGDRRVFAVDNGISFGGFVQNWFVKNWHKIRVPALPRVAIDRLRKVTPEQIATLATVAELQPDAAGVLRNVAPSANLDADEGARVTAERIQLGLTESEIEDLEERLEELIDDVDDDDIDTF